MPRLNKAIINPIQRLWAPYLPPYAVIVHHGRKSGATYRTPVLAFKHKGKLIVLLVYGDRTQWIRNLTTAGGGEIVRRGRRQTITGLQITDGRAAGPELPRRLRRAARPLRIMIINVS